MIHYKKLIIIVFCFPFLGFSQDLFNLENSLKFAKYLKNQGELEFALQEYTRSYYLAPKNQKIHFQIVHLNRLLKNYKQSILFINRLSALNSKIQKEKMYCLLKLKDFKTIDTELNENSTLLTRKDKNFIKITSVLMQDDWEAAQSILEKIEEKDDYIMQYESLIEKKLKIKEKNPLLAGGMSLIIPGLGKLYAGEKKDALFNFLTIGLGAWQTYYSFKNSGVKSVSGWLYGGITLFFHSGNIYGSYSSAKSFNQKQHSYLNEEIYNISNHYIR